MGEADAEDGRVKRPILDRTDPIRSFAGMFGTGSSAPGGAAARDGGGFADIARTSIEAAYRVVDAQMEYGRQVARQMGLTVATAPVATNGQSTGGANDAAFDTLVRAYASGVAEVTAAWMKAFFDVMAQAQQGQRNAPETVAQTEETSSAPAAKPRRIFMPLTLRAGEHGSVETPVLDGIDPRNISVSALTSRENRDAFMFVQVSTVPDTGVARLSMSVPADQATGTYDAVISERHGLLLGALTVTVEAP